MVIFFYQKLRYFHKEASIYMKICKKYGISTIQLIGLLITLLLIVGGLVITIVKRTPSPVRTVLICIGYLLVLYYALLGYKKPHGNMLRYTMLFFAILIIFLLVVDPALKSSSAQPLPPDSAEGIADIAPDGAIPAPPADDAETGEPVPYAKSISFGLACLAAVLIAYVAGRLNKIKTNRVLILIAGAMLLARCFVSDFHAGKMPANANEFNMWLAMAMSYLCRYQQHKEAGLIDSTKEQPA